MFCVVIGVLVSRVCGCVGVVVFAEGRTRLLLFLSEQARFVCVCVCVCVCWGGWWSLCAACETKCLRGASMTIRIVRRCGQGITAAGPINVGYTLWMWCKTRGACVAHSLLMMHRAI